MKIHLIKTRKDFGQVYFCLAYLVRSEAAS